MATTDFKAAQCRIKAIGVGGGGCNAVNRMVRGEIPGVDFIAANTDVQALMANEAPTRIQLGPEVSHGLGVGGDPGLGRKAAEESEAELGKAMRDADMVFIAAGMGGGTGTGASPVIARLAKEAGALTVAIVTKPFEFEMGRRLQIAEEGIKETADYADAAIVIPNERLLGITGDKVTVDSAFRTVDDVLMVAVRAITEVITVPGLVNLDFADVRAVMQDAGTSWLSIGYGTGQNRVVEAAQAAISSDLLDVPIDGARGVLYVVSGPADLTLAEVSQAAEVIESAVDEEAMVIFGVTGARDLDSDVRITLVATGFSSAERTTARRDEEFRDVIREVEADESRLETPAYMRRPVTMRRITRKT